MIKRLTCKSLQLSAVLTVAMIAGQGQAMAGGNNFGSIARNINASITDLPGLLSAVAYLFGIILGVLGVLKIKDHVENPGQTPLKDGAIRLAAGGALFALPIIYEAMLNTVGAGGQQVTSAQMSTVNFGGL